MEVVYLQPRASGDDRIISYRTVAEHLTTLNDPLAMAFAVYVERWIEPAASQAPRR